MSGDFCIKLIGTLRNFSAVMAEAAEACYETDYATYLGLALNSASAMLGQTLIAAGAMERRGTQLNALK